MSPIRKDQSVRRGPSAWVLPLSILVVLAGPQAVRAADSKPMLSGSILGPLEPGGRLSVHIRAGEAGGWRLLHGLAAELVIGGAVADRVAFDVENSNLVVGDHRIAVGTGGVATSTYFRVSGADVIVTTGGAWLDFTIRLTVLKEIPAGATFRLSAVDDLDVTTTITRRPNAEAGARGGLTWESVILAVALALFAGGFLGNLFASKRRPQARPSIYATVQRRLEEERAARGSAGGRTSPRSPDE